MSSHAIRSFPSTCFTSSVRLSRLVIRQQPAVVLATLVMVVLLALTMFLSIRQRSTTIVDPFADLYRNDTQTQCQETRYQPFLVGCPVECHSYRPDMKEDEPMYRLTLEWYLGQPKLSLHPPLPGPDTYYEMGYNYECPMDFVDAFGKASDALEAALLKQAYPDLNVKTQARMHVSLAYLCCLRLEEAYHVREIMEEWVHTTSFDVPSVTFERIECWKERFNSITHIIVVDSKSQQRLLSLLQLLEDQLHAANIPVPIARQTQMPFHSTLLGVHMGSKFSLDPNHSIDPILPVSFATLKSINRDVWPAKGVTFDIQYRPKFLEASSVANCC